MKKNYLIITPLLLLTIGFSQQLIDIVQQVKNPLRSPWMWMLSTGIVLLIIAMLRSIQNEK